MPRIPTRSSSKKSGVVDFRALSSSELPLPDSKRSCHERGSTEPDAIAASSLLDLDRPLAAPVQQCMIWSAAAAGTLPMDDVQGCGSSDHLRASGPSPVADRSQPWNVPGPRVAAPGAIGVDVGSYLGLQFAYQRSLQDQLCKSQQSEQALQAKCAELEQQIARHSVAMASLNRYADGAFKMLAEHTSPVVTPLAACLRLERLSPASMLSQLPSDVVELLVRRVQPPALYVIGGGDSDGQPMRSLDVYHMDTQSWSRSLPSLHLPRYYGAGVAFNGQVMSIGGDTTSDRTTASKFVDCYSPVRSAWTSMPRMLFARAAHAAASLGDSVFILGGQNDDDRSGELYRGTTFDVASFVEHWRPNLNQWGLTRCLLRPRRYMSCVSVANHVYAIGGWNGRERTAGCEMFDGIADKWVETASMIVGRNCASAAAPDANTIYNIGGWNGERVLGIVERLDIREGAWRPVRSLAVGRKDPAAVALDSSVVVLGGVSDNVPDKAERSVEEYDARANEWRFNHPMTLPTPRYACSAVWLPSPSAVR